MDFELCQEQKMLRDMARKFAEQKMLPSLRDYESARKVNEALLKKMASLDLRGIHIPKEYGGSGLSYSGAVIIWEQLSQASWTQTLISLGDSVLAGTIIMNAASPEQKERYLPPMCRAESFIAVAAVEPNAGSDASAVESSAVLDGNEWVINGTKNFITGGGIADAVIFLVQTNKSLGPKGIALIAIDKNTPGLSSVDVEFVGGLACNASNLAFADCRVPRENLIGDIGKGLKNILTGVSTAPLFIAAGAVGMAQSCLEACVKYTKERSQFGRPIASFQLMQEAVARIQAEILSMRWLVYYTADLMSRGLPHQKELSSAKWLASELAVRAAAEAIRIHGAYGCTDDYPVAPDRVPVNLPVGNLPNILHGVKTHTAMYDIEKAIEACKAFNKKYSDELEYHAMPFAAPGKAMEILDYKLYAFPGHGLAMDAPGYQFVEGEYMKLEEYEDFFRDPSDFWLRVYLPRIFGAFEGFRRLPPLTDILEIPTGQLMALAQPQVLEAFQKLVDAGKDLQKRNAIMAQSTDPGAAHGYPSWMGMGVLGFAPFDAIGDTLRGTKSIMMDMFRNGDKLLKAIDIMTDIIIYSILHSPMIYSAVTASFPLHKGADGWMSPKQYEKFYWPSLKKLMDALINEGLICQMFAEGSYNTRLEVIHDDFPKGSVVWWFDQTDMASAKKILGDRFAIQGNVPSSLMVTGSPADVKACCRKLIETCGKGGGYIMAAGCIAENPKLENLRAMMEAVREYGVYR